MRRCALKAQGNRQLTDADNLRTPCARRACTHVAPGNTLLRPRSSEREQRLILRAQGDEYFDEGAAQVKRLLDRDRSDFKREDGEKAEYDVDDDGAHSAEDRRSNGTSATSSRTPTAIDEELQSMKNPMGKAFKSAPKKGAFGSSSKSPFGSDSMMESQGDMWTAMEPIDDDDDKPWWQQITFGQVAIALSFVTVIALMLTTAWVTVKLGAVHFNE